MIPQKQTDGIPCLLQHPHRGFETITIAFQGEVEHGDSVGNRDVIGPGDVQWMTAARGIIHEEFHSDKFTARGGTFEMCQLWLNLPAKHKMDPPKYQPILAKQIPAVPISTDGDDGVVRVIAGEFRGTKEKLTVAPLLRQGHLHELVWGQQANCLLRNAHEDSLAEV